MFCVHLNTLNWHFFKTDTFLIRFKLKRPKTLIESYDALCDTVCKSLRFHLSTDACTLGQPFSYEMGKRREFEFANRLDKRSGQTSIREKWTTTLSSDQTQVNTLTSVFYASVLLLIMNFVITLST